MLPFPTLFHYNVFHTAARVICSQCKSDNCTLLLKVTPTTCRIRTVLRISSCPGPHWSMTLILPRFSSLVLLLSDLFFVVSPTSQEHSQLTEISHFITMTQRLFPYSHYLPNLHTNLHMTDSQYIPGSTQPLEVFLVHNAIHTIVYNHLPVF